MKKNIFLLLLVSLKLFAQADDDNWCKKGSADIERDDIRKTVYMAVLDIKSIESKIDTATYKELRAEYKLLQIKFNSLYRKVSYDIKDGYLLTGKTVICKKYGETLRRNILEAKDYTERLNAEYEKATLSKSKSPLLILEALISSFNYLKNLAQQSAKEKAQKFYNENKWLDFEKITDEVTN